ncbi:hypothetical protein OZX69_02920 [Lactobacillus sp. ESL0731]|uniref:hypothetical protein n=1 Tax=unclassified Lactobacillus TaxID=2620435 RepID=UPI0023F658C2|nr:MULTISPECIES: hypothetical protein [unclassified Lactobacillus]WEV51662.1 hypothetical protein OZX63_02920 [Lactobacillus sp. ESL0700]WEV62791.1 hypothetical protein OZX69_02920 [Lactobacillus sp. ESL0731]
MDKKYFSNAFPAATAALDIHEYNGEDFQKVLDCLFLIANGSIQSSALKQPLNILVAETTSFWCLAINFDKAIFGETVFNDIVTKRNDKEIEPFIRKVFFEEIGMNTNAIIRLPKSSFDKIFNKLLCIFNKSGKVNERVNMLATYNLFADNDVEKCVIAIAKGLSRGNSLYGGKGMWVNPIFQAKDLTIDPNMCFSILPFTKERLEILTDIVKPALENDFNINVIKSGDVFDANLNIMESIWTYINKARFVIADLSEKNPNVFYELGICHTLGKKVITICDKKSYEEDYKNKLPFDIGFMNTIFYENKAAGSKKMIDQIENNVRAIISGKPYINSESI